MKSNNPIPQIVKLAMVNTITDIGQLSKSEVNTLNSYVKKGWLSKGKGGHFPLPKTVYAHPGFDFVASRKAHVQQLFAFANMR
jgi:hypothetical protein